MALPVVEFLYGFPALDPSDSFFDAIYDGVFGTATSTRLPLTTDYGARIVFTGEFVVDGSGVVTGGTVTGFRVFTGNTKVETGSGYEIPAIELIAAVEAWQMFDFQPFEDLLLDVPARYIGSELGDFVFSIDGFGSVFLGRQGDDELFTASAGVTLKGGKDNDLLLAWEGECWYSGGEGKDVFAFVDPAAPNKIRDFSPGDDLFSLNTSMFAGVEPGFLDDSQFKVGRKASTPEQIILFQRNKGNIWFDQDGSESTYAPVKFAKVDKGIDLGAGDFFGEDYGMVVA
jgi:hypothetical protein